MRPQFHITLGNQAPIVIDLNEDETIDVTIDWNPFRKKQAEPDALVRISGLRWRNEQHFHLTWGVHDISQVALVTVANVVDDLKPTAPEQDVLYVKPEPSCCFCFRKASEVKTMIQRGEIPFKAMWDECVDECYELLQEQRSASV